MRSDSSYISAIVRVRSSRQDLASFSHPSAKEWAAVRRLRWLSRSINRSDRNRICARAKSGEFLTSAPVTRRGPAIAIPGTKMIFAGVKDEQKIKNLIAYLHQSDKAPVRLVQ